MANHFGNRYHIQIFGQSHAHSIGAVIEGLPAGFSPDWERVRQFMARRAPGQDAFSTSRKEADLPEILSGLDEKGRTCGAPLAIRIVNGDHHSTDYDKLRDLPRPGHADFTAYTKFNGFHDIRGGGQFSGRLTAPLCFAGALALQLLEQKGIRVSAHIAAIAGVCDKPFNPISPEFTELRDDRFTVLDANKGSEMKQKISEAAKAGDSVGGIIECCAIGLPPGLGDPMFDGIENRIAQMLFAIPAVRGVEFGAGFAASAMTGSAHNDPFVIDNNTVKTSTNHHGGVLGGITTGMPLIVRMAVKPTPSISRKQKTISLNQMSEADLSITGRHDPCIVPRAVPVMEAAIACVLYDLLA
ncbi:MAG: chorismate synthase [Clostridia bacterium]|nr:chorismate synthase [Clostridia bacterium]